MESQSLKTAVSPLFSAVQKQKSQQLHFCKSLTLRAETEI